MTLYLLGGLSIAALQLEVVGSGVRWVAILEVVLVLEVRGLPPDQGGYFRLGVILIQTWDRAWAWAQGI